MYVIQKLLKSDKKEIETTDQKVVGSNPVTYMKRRKQLMFTVFFVFEKYYQIKMTRFILEIV